MDRETSRKHQGPVSVEALWGGFGELTRQFLAIMAAPLPIPTSPHLAGQTDATQGHQAEAGRLGSNRLEIDASGAICAPFSNMIDLPASCRLCTLRTTSATTCLSRLNAV